MNYFHYVARRDNGLTIKGWLFCRDKEEALTSLRQRQLSPLVVKAGPGHIPTQVPMEELYASMRELSSMRLSGMPLEQAIEAMKNIAENEQLKKAWEQVEEMLHSGLPLSESFAALPEAFPSYVVPMVKLGEANGKLAEALESIAQRMEDEQSLRSEIKTAITYPAFLIIISFVIILALLLFVIPQFTAMVDEQTASGNLGMTVLIGVSNWLNTYYWLWGGAIVLSLVYLNHSWKQGVLQNYLWKTSLFLPLINKIVIAWEVVQFSRSMQRLLVAGVNILEALELTTDMVNRQTLKRKLEQILNDVRKGQSLGNTMEQHKVFPTLVIQMISIGEKSASLDNTMEQIGNLYEKRMRDSIKRSLSLLEPAVIVFMGGFIGLIMVTLMSAIISLNDIPL